MGVTPIEYRPWDGKRTDYWRRFLVISNNVFRQKLKSKWVLALLIIGVILTHVSSIIIYTVFPHEELTPEMMVGTEPEEPEVEPVYIDGRFEFLGMATLKGSAYIEGGIFGFGTIKSEGLPLTGTVRQENGFAVITGTVVLNGELELLGGVTGVGNLDGNFSISGFEDIQLDRTVEVNGSFELNGSFGWRGRIDIDGSVYGMGTVIGDGTPVTNITTIDNRTVLVNGNITIDGEMDIYGGIAGTGYFDGNSVVSVFGVSIGEVSDEEEQELVERQGGYLKNGALVIFTILLASLVCSDLISADLGDNSFILYFSRPIKTIDYLAGKILGALWVLGLFCFLPLIIFCLAVMGTQSSSDYGTSFNVLGSTILAGLLTAFIFLPYGIFISSMTKRKTYATIGIFMSFFVLIIIGEIFSYFNKNWVLIDPTRVLFYSYDVLYGFSVPEGINSALLGAVLFIFMVIPLALVYLRIHLKAVGK